MLTCFELIAPKGHHSLGRSAGRHFLFRLIFMTLDFVLVILLNEAIFNDEASVSLILSATYIVPCICQSSRRA